MTAPRGEGAAGTSTAPLPAVEGPRTPRNDPYFTIMAWKSVG